MKNWLSKLTLPVFLAVATTAGFFYFLNKLFAAPVPQENSQLVTALVTVISAAWGSMVGFFFGASVGSAKKTDAMLKQLSNGNGDTTTLAKTVETTTVEVTKPPAPPPSPPVTP